MRSASSSVSTSLQSFQAVCTTVRWNVDAAAADPSQRRLADVIRCAVPHGAVAGADLRRLPVPLHALGLARLAARDRG